MPILPLKNKVISTLAKKSWSKISNLAKYKPKDEEDKVYDVIDSLVSLSLSLVWLYCKKWILIGITCLFIILIVVGTFYILIANAQNETLQSLKKSSIQINQGNESTIDKNIIKQEFITVNNQQFGLPLKTDITKLEKLMLLGIRIPEWGTRRDNSSVGDLDSVCPYQQRASEIMENMQYQTILNKYVNYNSVFSSDRINFLNKYKNLQLRNIPSTVVTFDYDVVHPFTGTHKGIDYGYVFESVATPLDGVVSEVIWDKGGGGNVIVISHASLNIRTLYAHLSKQLVKVGDVVRSGQIIGVSGDSSPVKMGAHLHFQIISNLFGAWNLSTIPPEKEIYISKQMRNKFSSMAQDIVSVHLRTGLCDEIALQRLANEPSTREWILRIKANPNYYVSSEDEINTLVRDLCRSQRPIDCNVWQVRAFTVLKEVWRGL